MERYGKEGCRQLWVSLLRGGGDTRGEQEGRDVEAERGNKGEERGMTVADGGS